MWSDTTEGGKPYSITSAPRIARGMVVIGNGGSEYGVRGYISAYDAGTGKFAWRSYTVPGDPSRGLESKAMEAPAKTWSGEYWKAGGDGAAWEGIVYDPSLDLLYFGTGNPTAWYRAIRGGGDSLYTASIVAVHAGAGEIAWHFQTTPGDNWDYDATQPLVQADLTIHGVTSSLPVRMVRTTGIPWRSVPKPAWSTCRRRWALSLCTLPIRNGSTIPTA